MEGDEVVWILRKARIYKGLRGKWWEGTPQPVRFSIGGLAGVDLKNSRLNRKVL